MDISRQCSNYYCRSSYICGKWSYQLLWSPEATALAHRVVEYGHYAVGAGVAIGMTTFMTGRFVSSEKDEPSELEKKTKPHIKSIETVL